MLALEIIGGIFVVAFLAAAMTGIEGAWERVTRSARIRIPIEIKTGPKCRFIFSFNAVQFIQNPTLGQQCWLIGAQNENGSQ